MLTELLFLIGSNQFCPSNDMACHCLFQLGLIGVMQIRQFNIQCVEFMKVPVSTDGWARAAIPRFFPVIFAL